MNIGQSQLMNYTRSLYASLNGYSEFNLTFEEFYSLREYSTAQQSARDAIMVFIYQNLEGAVSKEEIASLFKLPLAYLEMLINKHESKLNSGLTFYKVCWIRLGKRQVITPMISEKVYPGLESKGILSRADRKLLYEEKAEEILDLIAEGSSLSKERIISDSHESTLVPPRVVFNRVFKKCFPKVSLKIRMSFIGGRNRTMAYSYEDLHTVYMDYSKNAQVAEGYNKLLLFVCNRIGLSFKANPSIFETELLSKEISFFDSLSDDYKNTANQILDAIAAENEHGHSREEIKRKYIKATGSIVQCKVVFLYFFSLSYPKSQYKERAIFIGVTSHCTINYYLNIHLKNIDPINKGKESSIEYRALYNRVREKLNLLEQKVA